MDYSPKKKNKQKKKESTNTRKTLSIGKKY